MSNDTGIGVYNKDGKWQVRSIHMSSEYESVISEHDTRAEAIDRASVEAEWPVEYGIIHIDKEQPHE